LLPCCAPKGGSPFTKKGSLMFWGLLARSLLSALPFLDFPLLVVVPEDWIFRSEPVIYPIYIYDMYTSPIDICRRFEPGVHGPTTRNHDPFEIHEPPPPPLTLPIGGKDHTPTYHIRYFHSPQCVALTESSCSDDSESPLHPPVEEEEEGHRMRKRPRIPQASPKPPCAAEASSFIVYGVSFC
jgi:hypothetical protein